MNFYSDQHDNRSRRSIFDLFWESDNYGILATKEPMMMVPMRHEFLPQIQSERRKVAKRRTGFSWKICLSDPSKLVSVVPVPLKLQATTPATPIKMRSSQVTRPVFENKVGQLSNATCQLKPRIVGYYKGWDGRVISDSQLGKLTHVIFKYLSFNQNGPLSFKNNLEEMKFMDLKQRVRAGRFGVKLMAAVEIMDYPKDQRNLITSISSFLHFHKLDGIDIDWRHPRPKDIPNQVQFFKSLREKLPNSTISMTASGTEWKYKYPMKIKEILEHVDFVNIFSFDYYSTLTSPPAPLFSGIGDYRGYNVDRTIRYFVCETGNSAKLNIGVPFYGLLWKDVKGLLDKNDGTWRHVDSKREYIPWRLLNETGFDLKKASWNRNAMVPYIWDPENKMYLGFENQKSLEKKMSYLKKKNIGGIMIDSIGDDDEQDSLLNSITENSGCLEETAKLDNYKC
ncbi:hypothetical protein CAEBREN_14730 [Caenorhabditis brenneri]|uniref:GH18 domain-containing protein n=1 Tax=Caenorhabditis brenneri TaxID=135651 RepID=G0NN60_CAEBE|nr:hypothetical protein CAEBREN_14730 [Caenorhabditis brenneri]